MNRRLADLQGLLYAENKHQVLVVLQGMDTSGKDGTIKHVFRTVNPLGVKVANFKRPNETELAHDYLWRVHEHTPSRGHITIFNRSHYEDVLVVRVHDLVPKRRWSRRYRHIRDFERMLIDEGTIVRKFFLHISNDEQKARLEERLRIRRSSGSSSTATSTSESSGTTTRRRTRSRWPRRPPTRRRGTSCRPTASGIATW